MEVAWHQTRRHEEERAPSLADRHSQRQVDTAPRSPYLALGLGQGDHTTEQSRCGSLQAEKRENEDRGRTRQCGIAEAN